MTELALIGAIVVNGFLAAKVQIWTGSVLAGLATCVSGSFLIVWLFS